MPLEKILETRLNEAELSRFSLMRFHVKN